jgi:hypothetical protein
MTYPNSRITPYRGWRIWPPLLINIFGFAFPPFRLPPTVTLALFNSNQYAIQQPYGR